MSSLHLTAGSEKPAEVKGQARLYSMKYCPFSHRVRLVLALKQIPHDVVNINLKIKPEWYFEINPEGRVPAYVDADGTLKVDSVAIANYLDEKYPKPALYCDKTKDRDLVLLDHYSKITDTFANCAHGKEKRQLKEVVAKIMDDLQEFEQELGTRETSFFGGDNPGMLDILMWPWVERAKALPLFCKQPASFDKDRFPKLMRWIVEMKDQPFVKENKCSYEQFTKHLEAMKAGNYDYDNI